MSDDIVTRLRQHEEHIQLILPPHLEGNPSIYAEAADEIESLRRTNKLWMGLWEDCIERQKSTENGTVVTERWQDIARNLYLFIQDPCTHNHWCDVCSSIDAYEKAVNGE